MLIFLAMACLPAEVECILCSKTGAPGEAGTAWPVPFRSSPETVYVDKKFCLLHQGHWYSVFSFQTYSYAAWKPHLLCGLCTDPVLYPEKWLGCQFVQPHCNMVRLSRMSKVQSAATSNMAIAQWCPPVLFLGWNSCYCSCAGFHLVLHTPVINWLLPWQRIPGSVSPDWLLAADCYADSGFLSVVFSPALRTPCLLLLTVAVTCECLQGSWHSCPGWLLFCPSREVGAVLWAPFLSTNTSASLSHFSQRC